MENQVVKMLNSCDSENSVFPPTILYNEGWMLRIILDWFSKNIHDNFPLSFENSQKWYSEALLPSQFLAYSRTDKLAESWTHADGVVGDFDIGKDEKGDLTLLNNAKNLIVVEAKMYSKLSQGVKNSRFFNQAARNVACIAEILHRSKADINKFSRLGFYVIAPEKQILKEHTFIEYMSKENIIDIVHKRILQYKELNDLDIFNEKEKWYNEWFSKTMNKIDIKCITWEETIDYIKKVNTNNGKEIENFYKKCKKFN